MRDSTNLKQPDSAIGWGPMALRVVYLRVETDRRDGSGPSRKAPIAPQSSLYSRCRADLMLSNYRYVVKTTFKAMLAASIVEAAEPGRRAKIRVKEFC